MSFFDMKARRENAAAKKKVVVAPISQPWVEKYRPKKLSDVSAQDHAISVLSRTIQSSNLPHMLFYGPPGTGKTSTILALAKELYGPEMIKSRILELNASDERGISIVREKVKNFARITVSAPSERAKKEYPCPPFKIIILDEADSMTSDAQSALRRTMETYSKTTRFCLICNYVTRIIDPLASRCAKFRFRPLDETNALGRLQYIAEEEKVNYEEGVLEVLLKSSEGDLRKAITFLQSAAKLTLSPKAPTEVVDGDDVVMADDENPVESVSGGAAASGKVTVSMVQEIAGTIPDDVIESLVTACKPQRMKSGFGDGVFKGLMSAVEEVMLAGWSATQLLTQLHDRILLDDEYSGEQKNSISWTLSEAEKRLTDGADEHIEILNVLTKFAKVIFN